METSWDDHASLSDHTAWLVDFICRIGEMTCLLSPGIRIKLATVIMFHFLGLDILMERNLKFNPLYNPEFDQIEKGAPFFVWFGTWIRPDNLSFEVVLRI